MFLDMAPQVGAHALEKSQGGRGVLLGGVPGVAQGSVVVLGAGMVGSNAAKIAVGMVVAFFPSTFRDLIAFTILLLILSIRPTGLFGVAQRTKI